MSDPAELYNAILTGNAKKAEEVTKAAIAANTNPSELVQKYMIPAMDEVGRRFECNEYFVPELLIAARAMKTALELITPHLVASGAEPMGRVVIGTVQGDLHDIGKNLVASMLEGGGFQVIDLGVDVPAEKFVEAAKEKDGTILALSALLDHHHDHDEERDRRLGQGRHPLEGQGHGRRRSDHPAIRQRDRRRRLQRQRQRRRGRRPKARREVTNFQFASEPPGLSRRFAWNMSSRERRDKPGGSLAKRNVPERLCPRSFIRYSCHSAPSTDSWSGEPIFIERRIFPCPTPMHQRPTTA